MPETLGQKTNPESLQKIRTIPLKTNKPKTTKFYVRKPKIRKGEHSASKRENS